MERFISGVASFILLACSVSVLAYGDTGSYKLNLDLQLEDPVLHETRSVSVGTTVQDGDTFEFSNSLAHFSLKFLLNSDSYQVSIQATPILFKGATHDLGGFFRRDQEVNVNVGTSWNDGEYFQLVVKCHLSVRKIN